MDERYFDMADALAEQDRCAAIEAAQRAISAHGTEECEACGELIPPDRMAAAPFATRCLQCQAALELHARSHRSPLCNLK